MSQPMYEELPPMSTNIRKQRSELMAANGIHLIFNVPRNGTSVTKDGPLAPYAGLCIAFLMYLPTDNAMFCTQVGELPKRYVVGWINDTVWGMYSMTGNGGEWLGKKDLTKRTFPKGYVYLYYYFKNENTLNGWVNDTFDLKDDSVHPYPVTEANNKILLGYAGFNLALVMEVHWVAWGSSHNREKGPEPAAGAKLFPRSTTGVIDFKTSDIFEMRTGTVVKIHTKYQKDEKSKNDGLAIGIGCATCTNQTCTTKVFGNYRKPDEIYTFRLTFTEKGALIHTKEDVSHVTMPSYDNFPVCRQYFTLENADPVNIRVETMGRMWV